MTKATGSCSAASYWVASEREGTSLGRRQSRRPAGSGWRPRKHCRKTFPTGTRTRHSPIPRSGDERYPFVFLTYGGQWPTEV